MTFMSACIPSHTQDPAQSANRLQLLVMPQTTHLGNTNPGFLALVNALAQSLASYPSRRTVLSWNDSMYTGWAKCATSNGHKRAERIAANLSKYA